MYCITQQKGEETFWVLIKRICSFFHWHTLFLVQLPNEYKSESTHHDVDDQTFTFNRILLSTASSLLSSEGVFGFLRNWWKGRRDKQKSSKGESKGESFAERCYNLRDNNTLLCFEGRKETKWNCSSLWSQWSVGGFLTLLDYLLLLFGWILLFAWCVSSRVCFPLSMRRVFERIKIHKTRGIKYRHTPSYALATEEVVYYSRSGKELPSTRRKEEEEKENSMKRLPVSLFIVFFLSSSNR